MIEVLNKNGSLVNLADVAGTGDYNDLVNTPLPLYSADIATAPTGEFDGQMLYITDTGDEFGNLVEVYAWIGGIWQMYPTPTSTSKLMHEVKLTQSATKGQAVYVSGSNGTNMLVSKADNTTEATSSKTLGLLVTSGATNDLVQVVTEGLLDGLDTSTATAGDPVWLGTNGNLLFGIANKPVAPAHMVYLGVVTRVNQNNGEIFVHVQNGFELDEIHDVLITTATDGQVLVKDGNVWKNKYTWEHLVTNAKTSGAETATTGGTYMIYTYKTKTIYRFLSTALDANGYNVEDSFYATLTGSTLSDLIITRG